MNYKRLQAPDAGWELWLDGAWSPAMNMAIDETLLETAGERHGRPLVRFYRWDRPCCSIGCFQSHAAVPSPTPFVRRPTGGGVVEHGDDITYTVVLPAEYRICAMPREESYACINQVVIAALASLDFNARLTEAEIPDHVDRRRMACFTTPTRYDVVLGDRKIAGAAQRRRREGILHQGSVALAALPNIAREGIVGALQLAFADLFGGQPQDYHPGEPIVQRARQRAAAKYLRDEWNRQR